MIIFHIVLRLIVVGIPLTQAMRVNQSAPLVLKIRFSFVAWIRSFSCAQEESATVPGLAVLDRIPMSYFHGRLSHGFAIRDDGKTIAILAPFASLSIVIASHNLIEVSFALTL
jgi:hypothetical protein